jgi:sulfite exporter TauE/SafE
MNLFFPMLGVGLLTGFHCVTMCGPMVFCYSIREGGPEGLLARVTPQLGYQAARILSYVTVGIVLGAIGAAINLAGVRGWATIVAGVSSIRLMLGSTWGRSRSATMPQAAHRRRPWQGMLRANHEGIIARAFCLRILPSRWLRRWQHRGCRPRLITATGLADL